MVAAPQAPLLRSCVTGADFRAIEEQALQRICVDMDEVMADTLAEHLRRYNQTFDEEVTPGDLVGKGLWEVTPLDRQKQLRAFLDAEDFFEDLALMPGAQEVLKSLSARFEIFIATQAMTVPNCLRPQVPLAATLLSLYPLHELRLLRQQVHSSRRLSDRRPSAQPAPVRGPGAALLRAPQPHRDRLYPRE
jgi:hypothetical protein